MTVFYVPKDGCKGSLEEAIRESEELVRILRQGEKDILQKFPSVAKAWRQHNTLKVAEVPNKEYTFVIELEEKNGFSCAISEVS